jgi:hypothetical protein
MSQLCVNIHKLNPNIRYKYSKSTEDIIWSGVFSHYGNETGEPQGRIFFTDVQNDKDYQSFDGIFSIPKSLITNIYVVNLFRGFGELNQVINSF